MKLILSGSLVLAGLGAASPGMAQTPLKTVRVAKGLELPIQATAPNGDRDRLFLVEQSSGKIKVLLIKTGDILSTPFLDLSDRVSRGGGERGLLGLAFHPKYSKTGYLYASYTRSSDGASIVERFKVSSGNPNQADKSSGAIILGPISQPYSNHNGGCLRFSPNDGYLYFGLGDGGSSGDPKCNAQSGGTFLGKLLRIDVDGGFPYIVPPDNPFVSDPTFRDEIWALGLRNPWRWNFDRLTGDLYLGDVGESSREEVSFQSGTSHGGENYGWKIMEGLRCNSSSNCPTYAPPCFDPGITPPIHEYTHSNGCSITGGAVYRGYAIPDLNGTYFFSDFCSDRIWSFRFDGANLSEFRDRTKELAPGGGMSIDSISSIDEDGDGEIYLCDLGGEVFKIVANAPPPAVDLGHGKGGSSGVIPEFTATGLLDSGNEALMRLRRSPAQAVALLASSTKSIPIQIFGGTLLAFPFVWLTPFVTDADGRIEFVLPGGGGPFDMYLQYLIEDPTATFQTSFSNGLLVTWQS